MAICRTIEIDGQSVAFKASAALPRIYRLLFRRDMMLDASTLHTAYAEKAEHGTELPVDILEIFENVTFAMAKHADPKIPDTAEEWLEGFGMFSIYTVLPHILELWKDNVGMMIDAKKKITQADGT